MSISYTVVIEKYAERHFISSFEKKYKNAWDVTWTALEEQFKRIDTLVGVSAIVEIIFRDDNIRICKVEFRMAGPGKSRHASGNRCIIAVHKNTCSVHVLLVYNKNDLGHGNETAQWKQIVKDNYPGYKSLL